MTCERNSDNKQGFISLIIRHLHLLFKQRMLPGKEGAFPRAWKEFNASANHGNNPEICGKNIGEELPGLGYEKCHCSAENGSCCDYAVGPEPRWRYALPDRRDKGQTMRRKPPCVRAAFAEFLYSTSTYSQICPMASS